MNDLKVSKLKLDLFFIFKFKISMNTWHNRPNYRVQWLRWYSLLWRVGFDFKFELNLKLVPLLKGLRIRWLYPLKRVQTLPQIFKKKQHTTV